MKKSYADMDPLEEIRAIREEISREFKTVSAYGEYLRKKYAGTNTTTETSGAGGQPVVKSATSRSPKTAKKASGPRKNARRMAHI